MLSLVGSSPTTRTMSEQSPVPGKLRRLKMSRRIFFSVPPSLLGVGMFMDSRKQEAQQLLLEVLESRPRWQWDRFIREHIE